MFPVVAIDGTAASGKSSLARDLAEKLGFIYVNTGEMYRGIAWSLLERGVAVEDSAAVERELSLLKLDCKIEDGRAIFYVDGINPASHAREGKVNEKVSVVAAIPAVRRLLVEHQQALSRQAPLVMEGRDIGTVVFPQTPYKFYVDADPVVRAQRRIKQGEKDVVVQRDQLDQARQTSPLVRAADAIAIDSTGWTVGQTTIFALEKLKEMGLEPKSEATA
jgi:cytidylate kinase